MQAFNLPGFSDSLRYLHNPKVLLEDLEETSSYKQRLAYDELLLTKYQCVYIKKNFKNRGYPKEIQRSFKTKAANHSSLSIN